MSKHQTTRPPPAASSGLDLDDVLNNKVGSKTANKKATTSFPATAEKSTRIKTEHAPLGNPGRTVVEGLAVPSALQTVINPTVILPGTQLGGMVSPSQVGSYAAHTPSIKSTAPTWAKSVLTKPEDQEMASRQKSFASLAPGEQAEQNTWAQTVINKTIRCPQGWDWARNKGQNGYQCDGGHHFITDELLAEGKGGVLLVPGGKQGQVDTWWGPYYPDPKKPDRLVYGGPKTGNHFSLLGPDWVDVKTDTWRWPKAWQLMKGLKGPPGNEADYPHIEKSLALLWYRPMKIHSNSHGVTLLIRRDKVGFPNPRLASQSRGGVSGSGLGAGSGISGTGSRRSSSDSHHSGSAPSSLGSHSNSSDNSITGSAPPFPGSHHSSPPPYNSNINVSTPYTSGSRSSNPYGSAQPPFTPSRYSNNKLWSQLNSHRSLHSSRYGSGSIPAAFGPNSSSGPGLIPSASHVNSNPGSQRRSEFPAIGPSHITRTPRDSPARRYGSGF
jgi:hypothetical protein